MNSSSVLTSVRRCTHFKDCHLVEETGCRGYRPDCPMYQAVKLSPFSERRLNRAMDRLIDRTISKYR